ncbi:efflux RND transporter periplasmic adaptor subunit [Lutimonas sp.]|uniref:efflux RND transporter periplasmic adaptor subunit n=1 Tax=Lutimonas sp. TaxID=1872403 RepID=UPI003C78B75C
MKKIYILFLVVSILFTGCKKEQQAVIPPQPFEVYEIKTKSVPIYQEFVGQIYGEKDIPIRARVVGFLDGIHFKEGERVQKGQLLYSIDPDPLLQEVAAQTSMVAQAQTVLAQAESDLKRIEPLAALSAVSEQELSMATSQRDAAASGLEAAKANLKLAELNLGYAKMYAPIEGIIGKTLAREGEFVGKEPNPVILNTVSQLSSVRVQFFLTERDYLKVAREYMGRTNNKVEASENDKIELQLILADGELYQHSGKVDFIDRNVDSETGSILVQATFPNPDRLIRPGQFARVKIKVREAKDAILIPQKCAKELQGQFSVMFVNNENIVESKQVVIIDKFGEFYLVEEGLKNGDKIIMEGLQKARSGMEIIPEVTEFVSQQTPEL